MFTPVNEIVHEESIRTNIQLIVVFQSNNRREHHLG
jgi:hypothetical protein